MNDSLSDLILCEDDYVVPDITDTTVIFRGIWGWDSYENFILPIIDKLHIKKVNMFVHDDGLGLEFTTKEEATLARLFFEG